VSGPFGKLPGMDDDTHRRLLHAVRAYRDALEQAGRTPATIAKHRGGEARPSRPGQRWSGGSADTPRAQGREAPASESAASLSRGSQPLLGAARGRHQIVRGQRCRRCRAAPGPARWRDRGRQASTPTPYPADQCCRSCTGRSASRPSLRSRPGSVRTSRAIVILHPSRCSFPCSEQSSVDRPCVATSSNSGDLLRH
jgi:hypothetical protein